MAWQQRFPNRGGRYRIPGDLSRPARPSRETVRYQNFHEALLAQGAEERLQFLLARSQTPASPQIEHGAPDTNARMGASLASTPTAPSPAQSVSTPLVKSIRSVPSAIGRSTGMASPRLHAAKVSVPRSVEPQVIDSQSARTGSFAEVERAIGAARASISVAGTPSSGAATSRERVKAAAALVAAARHAWTAMRGEVQEMLTQMQHELAVEAQSQIAAFANHTCEPGREAHGAAL